MESVIRNIQADLQNGRVSCAGLVKQRIGEMEESPHNTANFLLKDVAAERALEADQRLAGGREPRVLEGIPFGLKDVYLLQGCPASASSDFLKGYKSPYTASAVRKLMDAGAIPIVKENCDSFGHGSSNENSAFGPARNAHDPERVPGGSSGGSAVNVARGYTAFSIGGDTGGSIRQPAGYNRVYGLKPTYGRISRYGLMAYASSTDCVGPISRSLEDIRILLNVMSGKDERDQTTVESEPVPARIFEEPFPGKGFRIGYYRSFLEDEHLDAKIREDFLNLTGVLRDRGIGVRELDFFDTDLLVSTYYVIAMAETASNLARLDGMNYGERLPGGSLKESYALTRSVSFTAETQSRIVGGNQVLSHGHSEEIYRKAGVLRDKITGSFERDFRSVDLILSPVSPVPPPRIGDSLDRPLEMYLSDAYTVGFSLGGLPTLTSPAGGDTGIQITAPGNHEQRILQFAKFVTDVA